jgi:redox-sensitive bicupin YhaK (pirin superfamily)
MIKIRLAKERGHADHGWLDSYHTFSFANYYDPEQMGFRSLRVINEDRVQPGRGFGTHPHRDMEIISYVLEGGLEHRDSLGTGSVIRPGDLQRMSAGTGVTHSEFNASQQEPVHFLQIWLQPRQQGIQPSYEQRTFTREQKQGRLRIVAAPDGRDESVRIHADALVYAGVFAQGESSELALPRARHAWVQALRGKLRINGRELEAGDGAAISDEALVRIEGIDDSELLLFDLA